MPKLSDTYARAYATCGEILSAEGRFPTIERVRERIGTNSPALIKRAIHDWTAALAVETQQRLQRPGVPETLLNATEQLWRLAQDHAEQTLTAQREALAQAQQALTAELKQAQGAHTALAREYDAYRQGAEQERDTLRSTLAQQVEAVRQAQAQTDRLHRDCTAAREAQAQLAGRLAEAQAAQQRSSEDGQARFDQAHQWHLRRIEEERARARHAAAAQIAQAESSLQAARQQVITLTEQLDQVAQQAHELRGENRVLQEERERLRQAHDAMAQTITDLQARLQVRTVECERLRIELSQLIPEKATKPRRTAGRKTQKLKG